MIKELILALIVRVSSVLVGRTPAIPLGQTDFYIVLELLVHVYIHVSPRGLRGANFNV